MQPKSKGPSPLLKTLGMFLGLPIAVVVGLGTIASIGQGISDIWPKPKPKRPVSAPAAPPVASPPIALPSASPSPSQKPIETTGTDDLKAVLEAVDRVCIKHGEKTKAYEACVLAETPKMIERLNQLKRDGVVKPR